MTEQTHVRWRQEGDTTSSTRRGSAGVRVKMAGVDNCLVTSVSLLVLD